MTATWRKPFWQLARLVIGLGLLALVLSGIEWGDLRAAAGRLNGLWLAAAFSMLWLALLVSVIRWRGLLRVQGIDLPFFTLFRYYLHAQFFTAVIPSFIGADVGRSWEIRQKTRQTAGGVASVLVERLAGLHAISILGLLAAWLTPSLADYPLIRALATLLCAGVSAAWLALLHPALMTFAQHWMPLERLRAFLDRLQTATRLYRQQPGVVLRAWLLSFGVQMCSILAVYLQARALLPAEAITLPQIAAFTGLVVAISAVPVSPGALGLQEGGYVVLMGLFGVSASDALLLSLIARAMNLMLALIGGLDYVFQPQTDLLT